ncbi:MAG TPA: hypothetical protein VD867_10540, partial [Burkholderiales bacterium]|nr:hypothetical protein [Burkholderiales bacterium]
AKFSVQYCLARALIDRKVAIEHFEGDAYTDAEVRRVTGLVQAQAYNTDQFPAENHFGAEIKVTLRGGTVVGAKVDQPAGRTSANALPQERLREKFENCALRVIPADATAAVYATIMDLEKVSDVRAVNRAMTADATAPRARPAVLQS